MEVKGKIQAYLDYWGLKEPVFQTNVAADNLYLSNSMRNKLERVLIFAERTPSLSTIVTPPGHCKSSLAQWIYQNLSQESHEVILLNIFRDDHKKNWLLPKLLEFFGFEDISSESNLDYFTNKVESINLNGKILTVLIDEAHKLTNPSAMQEIHALISIQSLVPFHVNFVLIGNCGLMEIIMKNQELRNRLGLSITIDPLTPQEVSEYIDFRLQMSKIATNTILPDAFLIIQEASGGIFSRINSLLENSLIEAFLNQEKAINSKTVLRAAHFLPVLTENTAITTDDIQESDSQNSAKQTKESVPKSTVEIKSLFYKKDKN